MLIFIILLLIILFLLLNQPCNKENFGCANANLACCAAGSYGPDSTNCKSCPTNQTSDWGIPNNNCKCPNADINSCKLCRDKCRPFHPGTKVCTLKKCPSNKTCESSTGQCK